MCLSRTRCEFGTRTDPLFTHVPDLLIRLAMCAVPIAMSRHDQVAMSAAIALFMGTLDGFARRWGSCSARSFSAEPQGLVISAASGDRVVPWASISGIQTFHHYNRIDYVVIHYRGARGIEVASCLDYHSEAE